MNTWYVVEMLVALMLGWSMILLALWQFAKPLWSSSPSKGWGSQAARAVACGYLVLSGAIGTYAAIFGIGYAPPGFTTYLQAFFLGGLMSIPVAHRVVACYGLGVCPR